MPTLFLHNARCFCVASVRLFLSLVVLVGFWLLSNTSFDGLVA